MLLSNLKFVEIGLGEMYGRSFRSSLKTDLRFAALKFAGGIEAKRRSDENVVKSACKLTVWRSTKLIG